MNRILLLATLIVFTGSVALAQEPESNQSQTEEDLNAQYNDLKQNAETYGEFKVFRVSKLDDFWSAVNDSISLIREDLSEKQNLIDTQQAEIDQLNTEFQDNENRFQENEYAATHIEFLGIDFTKSTFKIMMSILVISLALIILIGYTQYNHNRRMAVQNAAECRKLENEYEDLRKKSLEKQIHLKRELQTERNLLEEIRSKSTVTKKISA